MSCHVMEKQIVWHELLDKLINMHNPRFEGRQLQMLQVSYVTSSVTLCATARIRGIP